jgi:hypothetical protein
MDRKEDLPKSEKTEKRMKGGEDPTALMPEGLREKGIEENRGPRRPAST